MTAEKFPTIAPNTYKENQIANRFYIVPNHQLITQLMSEEYFNYKGRLISKGNFGVFKFTKKPTKFFEGFLPWPLKWVKTKYP